MKRLKYIVPIILLLLAVFFGYRELSMDKIDRVLKTKEYSYLPKEAKNYIRNVYNKTGEIILTEKNKEENKPYLSPSFARYLGLSEKEKESISVIPEVYDVDYIGSKIVGSNLPSSYNLSTYNNKNFMTPLKNQENLSICWSFAAIEQAESYLLQEADTSYSISFPLLSTRQLDYGTSTDGIKDFENDFGTHLVGDGGNFFMASSLLTSGLALTRESNMPFNNSKESKELYKVHNYSNSLYEVDSTVSFPKYESVNQPGFDEYINIIKSYVMAFGGAYVATESPDQSCGFRMGSGDTILRVDDSCVQNSGHAMQIIGWDDNFSYSYCKNGSKHTSAITCSDSSNIVNGTGAWILRNSWGTNSNYKYVYMAYDSLESDISVSTAINSMSTRSWDNYYHKAIDLDNLYYAKNENLTFTKSINTPEKVEKVKIYALSTNANFKLSITSGNDTYNNILTGTVELPGYYTFDLSDKNIIINDSNFTVKVETTNNTYLLENQTSVFTSNVSNEPLIKTNDVHLTDVRNDYYDLYIDSNTKEIAGGTTLTYALVDSEDRDCSNLLTVIDNVVARNNIHAHVKIKSTIEDGIYKLLISNGNRVFDSRIFVGEGYELNGSGTVSDPYLISSEEDLKAIEYNLDAHYKLINDIYLEDDWIPIGTRDNPFTGSLNGNEHTISDLYIDDDYDYAGLFGYIEGNTNGTTAVKNLYFDTPYIRTSGDAGVVAGVVNGSQSNSSVTISGIYILKGSSLSTANSSGALIGRINGYESPYGLHTYTINNIFNSSDISGMKASGLIGTILGNDNDSNKPVVNITNVENLGDITNTITGNVTPNSKGAFVGVVQGYSTVNLNYFFTNTYLRASSINYTVNNKGLIGSTSYTDNLNIGSNGYSIYDNVNLLDSTIYSNWTNFNNYWKIESFQGITRYPVIKKVDIPHTNFYEIDMAKGQTINLSDYLYDNYPNSVKLYGYTPDSDIISVNNSFDGDYSSDVLITANKYGSTSIRVKNYYDGFDGYINISIAPQNPTYIFYYSNNDYDDEYYEIIDNGESIEVNENTFTYEGHRFKEWNTEADGTGTSYQAHNTINNITEDLNLYAIWDPFKYTVKYNSNGGRGSMDDQVFYYGDMINVRDNTFTRDGFDFVGWNTSPNGMNGTSYNSGDVISELEGDGDVTITLFAQWREHIDFDIDYDVDEAANIIDKVARNTTLDDYLTHFTYDDSYRIEVDMKGKQYISTGSTTKIYKNNSLVREYINVVRGDINGDSNISALDYVKVKNHIMGTNIIATLVELLAADANQDEIISALDYVRIKNIIMNGGN